MLTVGTVIRQRVSQLRSRRHADSGITLAELLVAMGLSMILGTMAVLFFVGANKSGGVTIVTNQQTSDARLTLDSWTSMIRVAGWLDPSNPSTPVDRFEEITPTKIVFYANLNNRNTPDGVVGPLTKVALMLNQPTGGGDGQLVEVRFKPDNVTPATVRQLGFIADQTNGAWIFTPRDESGGPVDTSVNGCVVGGQPAPGLCAKAPTTPSPGMIDPTLAPGSHTVVAGTRTGDGSQDAKLANIGDIDIAFTVTDSHHLTSSDYTSSASVNSGFPDESSVS